MFDHPHSTELEEIAPPPTPQTDSWGVFLAILLLLVFLMCQVVGPVMTWLVWEGAGISGITIPAWVMPTAVAVTSSGLTIILWLFAAFWSRSLRFKAVFQTWTLAAVFTLFMIGLRAITPISDPNAANPGTLWQIGGALLFVGFLWLVARQTGKNWARGGEANRWPAFLLAPLVLGAFFVMGSLGSPLDIVLQGIAGGLFGLVVGRLIGTFMLPALYQTSPGPGRDITLGTTALFGTLLLMAPAYGLLGQSTLLLAIFPLFSLLLMTSMSWGQPPRAENWRTVAWVIGLTTAVLLILVDADELNLFLVIEPGEIFRQLLIAGGIAAGTASVLGIGSLFIQRPMAKISDPVGSTIASGFWLIAILVYAIGGSPGFHGDRLFVIMADQADVSAAAGISDIDERRAFVYDTLATQARGSQEDLLATLDRFFIDHESFYLVNAVEVEGGPFIRWWLSRRPDVDRVIDSFDARPLPFPHPTSTGSDTAPADGRVIWNLQMVGADRVWADFEATGNGVVVGNSDSGVQFDHPQIADSYRGRDGQHNFNWYDPWTATLAPTDYNGHGTHTIGSVLGNTTGVAPDAEWIGCANLQRPLGSPGKYLACLEFMLAPFPQGGDPQVDGRPDLAADVLNNSWACPPVEGCDPTSLQPALDALRAAGIFVVASAGNEGLGGCSTVNSPIAIYDSVFSVGAINRGQNLAEFSSLGPVTVDGSGRPKPDIVAPGVGILSAFPESTYATTDGTSMAGPHVAGVVALVWSANPDLVGNIEGTEQILQDTARPLDGGSINSCGDEALPNNLVGYGLVDAYAAVQSALER
ncbi:MAG: S8 family serine peptidase [Ardenticatenaceae bacterium]|nr:S8 family serine peptidase [Ardenticatenaceae bacterium]